MAEFIGARISLISRSDIRYVGTLHEINSETSTVALENVTSHGTEGRKNNPDEEIAASESVYDYIVFRGSDVKDLRIEEAPVTKENKPPQVPNDPAILGSGSRPPPRAQQTQPPTQNQNQGSLPPQQQQQQQQGGPPFGQQHPQYPPPFYPPPPNGWGRGGMPPPGPNGFPPMPYGAPPGWYPPPGQGFPQHPGPFPPYGYPPGPPGQFQQHGPGAQQAQQNQAAKPSPIGPGTKQTPPSAESQGDGQGNSSVKPTEMPAAAVEKPLKPAESKSADDKSAPEKPSSSQNAPASKSAAVGPKSRLQPALPLQAPAVNKEKSPLQSTAGNTIPASTHPNPSASLRDATQAATAAVAAAMAKLPQPGQTNGGAIDNLTRQVNEMRTTDPIRAPRHPGPSGAGFGQPRGRGARPNARAPAAKTEVPDADFDFESANAKFNKQDLVKEAIAGSPLGEHAPSLSSEEAPAPVYNKSTSFFDNISSEAKDRAEASNGNGRPGGREWRGEEQKKNVETFGQGSVDNGYRGGFRGRGRGRGRGFRGRGYSGTGQPRGGYRGDRNDAQAAGQ